SRFSRRSAAGGTRVRRRAIARPFDFSGGEALAGALFFSTRGGKRVNSHARWLCASSPSRVDWRMNARHTRHIIPRDFWDVIMAAGDEWVFSFPIRGGG